ncbi:MAG: tRNA (adenosine(37)-N6)-threonylcarbamoyltransferase complex ATPase subunit type 1 TsaE [Phycisphaera sp.]|nr:tRNA (adenosine(37)-N6)-threonylcarbamoyltransferase complex ATPase subunit type 1 TsaE [Phycisphaera sp.]
MAEPTHLIRIECFDEETTERVGEIIAELSPRPVLVALEGELGAGKTRLARGLARGLGLEPDSISSPTFVIHVEHPSAVEGGPIFSHLDAYRVADTEELEPIGFEEIVADPDRLVAVEWASRIASDLPPERIEVRIDHRGERERAVTVVDRRDDRSARTRLREAFEARTNAWCTTLGGERCCPSCGKRCEDPEARPFCSNRCRLADLEGWFGSHYSISRPLNESDLLDD